MDEERSEGKGGRIEGSSKEERKDYVWEASSRIPRNRITVFVYQQNVKTVNDEDIEAYKYALFQSGISAPLNYYRNMLDNGMPRGLYSRKIAAPTLIIWVSGAFRIMLMGKLSYTHTRTHARTHARTHTFFSSQSYLYYPVKVFCFLFASSFRERRTRLLIKNVFKAQTNTYPT